MKAINLFVDFEFTSLSPDAQPISVGIVSEEYFNEQYRQLYTDKVEIKKGNCSIDHLTTKSFYAEFSDFDINRCDQWVRDNVVGKLMTNTVAEKLGMSFENAKDAAKTSTNWSREYCILKSIENEIALVGNTWRIKEELKNWLSQFSDYQITFVVDCGCYDWYHLLQLLAIWDNVGINDSSCPFCGDDGYYGMGLHEYKTGLPTLPINVSPVPFELNQFIAEKKGISVREAFDLNREELAFGFVGNVQRMVLNEWHEQDMAFFGFPGEKSKNDKHNALWDAKVMKEIYEKLK